MNSYLWQKFKIAQSSCASIRCCDGGTHFHPIRNSTGVCTFRFLVFKIPDFDPFFAAFTGVSFGLGPNFCLSKIIYLKQRTLFAVNYNLVAGHTIKVAL